MATYRKSTSVTIITTMYFSAFVVMLLVTLSDAQTLQYGVILDAGSSGSRVHVYQWERRFNPANLPKFNRSSWKAEGGKALSDYAQNLDNISEHLAPFLNWAKMQVPEHARKHSSIYVLATAGMRLLIADKHEAVMNNVNLLLSNKNFNPFKYTSRNTRILSGEEEGAFAWISVNYLNGFFDNPDQLQSTGIVEMGGASTQIAFLASGSILSDKFDMRIATHHYSIYVHSYLDYGNTAAQTWIMQHLMHEQHGNITVRHPCFPIDYNYSCPTDVCDPNITFVGSSDPSNCMRVLKELIYKVDTRRCSPKPCAIGSVYQPAIQRDMEFIAMSSFYKVLSQLKVLRKDFRFQPSEMYQPAMELCGKDISALKRDHGKDVKDERFLPPMCFSSLYSLLLFTEGFGFSNCSLQMISRQSIKNVDLDWSLGAIIYETERENWECVLRSSATTLNQQPFAIFFILMLLIAKTTMVVL